MLAEKQWGKTKSLIGWTNILVGMPSFLASQLFVSGESMWNLASYVKYTLGKLQSYSFLRIQFIFSVFKLQTVVRIYWKLEENKLLPNKPKKTMPEKMQW